MLKAFCKRRKGTLVLLGIALAVLAFVWIKIRAVPGTFQHVYAAPQPVAAEEGAQETNGGLREARLKTRELETELEGACDDATLYALAQPAAVSVPDGGKSASTRLVGVEESWFYLNSPVLLNGRLLYPDECIYGERVALVAGPDAKTYLVRVNDRLLDGTVRAITADALVCLQDVNDPLSLTKQREVRMTLRAVTEAK